MSDFPSEAYDRWRTTPPDDGVDDEANNARTLEDALHCPFCGNVELEFEDKTFKVRTVSIRCHDCGMRGPDAFDIDEAVAKWNKRKDVPTYSNKNRVGNP